MKTTVIHTQQTITVKLENSPNLLMPIDSGRQVLTLDAIRASVFIADGQFRSVSFEVRHFPTSARTFEPDQTSMPNWVRDLVNEVLTDYPAEWPMGQERAREFDIQRRDADTGEVMMRLAVVDPEEVWAFLKTKREKYLPGDFMIVRDGDKTVNGEHWLVARSHKKVAR